MPILFWDILLLKLTHPAVGLFQSSSFGYSVEMFSIDGPVLSGSVFLVTMQVVIPVPVHREIVVDMSHPCPHFLQQRIVHLLCTERIVGMQEGFIQSMSDFQHGLFRELGNPLPVQPLSVAIEVLRVDLQFFRSVLPNNSGFPSSSRTTRNFSTPFSSLICFPLLSQIRRFRSSMSSAPIILSPNNEGICSSVF